MAQNQLLILDLDRTLFDTGAFIRDCERRLAGREVNGTEDAPDLEVCRYFTGQAPSMTAAVESAAELLPRSSYCYPDSRSFLDSLPPDVKPVVMTYTDIVPYQKWKLGFAPELTALPIDILTLNKGEVIAAGVSKSNDGVVVDLPAIKGRFRRVLMIEDNPWALQPIIDAGAPVTMIHLARPGERYADVATPPQAIRVTSLEQARELL